LRPHPRSPVVEGDALFQRRERRALPRSPRPSNATTRRSGTGSLPATGHGRPSSSQSPATLPTAPSSERPTIGSAAAEAGICRLAMLLHPSAALWGGPTRFYENLWTRRVGTAPARAAPQERLSSVTLAHDVCPSASPEGTIVRLSRSSDNQGAPTHAYAAAIEPLPRAHHISAAERTPCGRDKRQSHGCRLSGRSRRNRPAHSSWKHLFQSIPSDVCWWTPGRRWPPSPRTARSASPQTWRANSAMRMA
jgi:hypothetical protein